MLNIPIFILSFFASIAANLADLATEHAVYVSVTEISCSPALAEGNMKVKLFTDDFEDAIRNQTGEKVKLTRQCAKNLELMANYVHEHLSLTVNESPVDFTIISCENVDISIWLEFTFACSDDWSAVSIRGDQLMELFPTQSNVFSVKYNDQKHMFRLTNSKRTTLITFD